MVGTVEAGAPRAIAGLYALTPDRLDLGTMTRSVGAALDGGARAIQYRNKTGTPELRLRAGACAARALRRAERGVHRQRRRRACAQASTPTACTSAAMTLRSQRRARDSIPERSSASRATTRSTAPRPRSRRARTTSPSAASSRPAPSRRPCARAFADLRGEGAAGRFRSSPSAASPSPTLRP